MLNEKRKSLKIFRNIFPQQTKFRNVILYSRCSGFSNWIFHKKMVNETVSFADPYIR